MKQLCLLFLLLSSSTLLPGQDFCGHIKYTYTYLRNRDNKDITARKKKDIKRRDVYICGNKYVAYVDGEFRVMFIGDSLTYFFPSEKAIIEYVDARKLNNWKTPNYSIRKNVQYKGKTYSTVDLMNATFYFNDDVKVNPKTFEFHWDDFFKEPNGNIPLVSIWKSKEETIISEAEVNRIELSDKDFALPANTEIKRHTSYLNRAAEWQIYNGPEVILEGSDAPKGIVSQGWINRNDLKDLEIYFNPFLKYTDDFEMIITISDEREKSILTKTFKSSSHAKMVIERSELGELSCRQMTIRYQEKRKDGIEWILGMIAVI